MLSPTIRSLGTNHGPAAREPSSVETVKDLDFARCGAGMVGGWVAGKAPWIDERGVMRVVLPRKQRTSEDVERFAEAARELTGGSPAPLIIDGRQVTSARPDAWLMAIANVRSFASAVAIVVSDRAPAEVAIFQTQINTFLVPCRIFADIAAAESWITSLDDMSAPEE